jgi:hypothetical protein
MTPLMSMRACLADKNLFANILPGESWAAWRILLIALVGEELYPEERAVFAKLTERATEPRQFVEEFVGIIGRRGGKSRAMSVLATYIAALCDHKDTTVPGERPLVLCLAQNQRQAAVEFSYIAAIFDNVPMLSKLIVGRTADTLKLSNGVSIEVRPANFRSLRGVTAIAVLADESCFWYSDESSLNADSEVFAAVRPCLATTRGPLIIISSPYARRGETWEIFSRYFGKDGPILVARGASRDLNPSLPQSVIDRAMERDAASASAEYGACWRQDIEAFLSKEVIEAVTVRDRFELPYARDIAYAAFVDAAGGSGQDSMTMAVAHADERRNDEETPHVILDCVREAKPPFSPQSVVAEFCKTLADYHITDVAGDRWGGEFVREQFEQRGISYECSEKPKSDLYRELMPLLNSRNVELLDHPRMAAQFVGLERKTNRGSGKDVIDHMPNQHDDVANSVCGALLRASTGHTSDWIWRNL